MRALTPWTGMGLFKDELERMFDRFLEPRWGVLEAVGDWTPRLDAVGDEIELLGA